ncbi:MAG: hypothetical protein KDB60_09380 [Propionibacteriaceae bacterium]|nr:hypothetical protein [Propionibacteriaceae bacterium]
MSSKVAGIVKGLAVVVWVLGALAGFSVLSFPGVPGNMGFMAMVVVWAYFFLAGIFTYAYGELLENVAETRTNTAKQLEVGARQADLLARLAATLTQLERGHGIEDAPAPAVDPVAGEMPPEAGSAAADAAASPAVLRRTDAGALLRTCPACGLEQPATRKRCWGCGAGFSE